MLASALLGGQTQTKTRGLCCEGAGSVKQEGEPSSKQDLIKFMTTSGLELPGGHLRIIHCQDRKGSIYPSARLAPSLVTACPMGNPSQPLFQAAHAQRVNIFPPALGKKQEAGRAAELRCCLSNSVWAAQVLTAAAGQVNLSVN